MGRARTAGIRWLWLAALVAVGIVLLATTPARSDAVGAQDTTTLGPAPTTGATAPPTTQASPPTTPVASTVRTTTASTVPRTTATTSSSTSTTRSVTVTAPPVSYTYVSTTVSSTTSTSIASIFGHLPAPASTVPLNTKGSNAHVNGRLGWLSAGGFGLAFLIMLIRFVVTRPRRQTPVSP